MTHFLYNPICFLFFLQSTFPPGKQSQQGVCRLPQMPKESTAQQSSGNPVEAGATVPDTGFYPLSVPQNQEFPAGTG